jgi:hypothetical protein
LVFRVAEIKLKLDWGNNFAKNQELGFSAQQQGEKGVLHKYRGENELEGNF